MTYSPAELYQQKEKRILDAMALRKPDRVPISPMFGFFPTRYAGMTIQETMYDPDKLWKAHWATMVEFEPDMDHNPFGLRFLGGILDALDYKQLLWAGHGLGPDFSYQFVEGEYMLSDEYDSFLFDPTDYMLRVYWPRVFAITKGMEKLPPLRTIVTYSMGTGSFAAFGTDEMIQVMESLKKAAGKAKEANMWIGKYGQAAKEAGFLMQTGGGTQAPFDTLSDYFRGMKGAMIDMYRRPDKVIAACEKLLPIMLEVAVAGARASGNPRVFIPIHKGIDGFMSEEQFRRFFWPTLRALMMGLIDEGLVPCPLWEGNCTSRLEIIKDIPATKAIYAFESTDIFKAKEVLGDRVCIRGNVPLSILGTGTPDDVRVYCKKLIDVVGKDGGFILDSSGGMDDARPENVKAMFEFTREYGVY
jgi:hypothetical protein